jgi:hypothetical protein
MRQIASPESPACRKAREVYSSIRSVTTSSIAAYEDVDWTVGHLSSGFRRSCERRWPVIALDSSVSRRLGSAIARRESRRTHFKWDREDNHGRYIDHTAAQGLGRRRHLRGDGQDLRSAGAAEAPGYLQARRRLRPRARQQRARAGDCGTTSAAAIAADARSACAASAGATGRTPAVTCSALGTRMAVGTKP